MELLDHVPEKLTRAVTTPDLRRYTARPDMIKLAKLHFHDSEFTARNLGKTRKNR